jgi:putative transposase
VAETLGVARSNLVERLAGRQQGRVPRYVLEDDERLLPLIREICTERASNGYRRVTVHLNRHLTASGERVNPKRVYRLMKKDGLLLARHTGRRPERRHEGQVITLKSNLRWCSDAFEIRCWSGEAVRVAFSLDCCDREAMRFVATTGGISAEQVRDLLVESVEQRFGQVERLPHPIEWLTDNGSCYTAEETVAFAKDMGFVVCTTPVKSPQSNGMAEAFVKTFKRDYVYLNDLPDAATVMAKLPEWVEDYNEQHPHRELKMCSPREFRRAASG